MHLCADRARVFVVPAGGAVQMRQEGIAVLSRIEHYHGMKAAGNIDGGGKASWSSADDKDVFFVLFGHCDVRVWFSNSPNNKVKGSVNSQIPSLVRYLMSNNDSWNGKLFSGPGSGHRRVLSPSHFGPAQSLRAMISKLPRTSFTFIIAE